MSAASQGGPERDASNAPHEPAVVTILIAGVEGGGVSLRGRPCPDGWEFLVEYVDQTPMLLGEPEIRDQSVWTRDWDEVLRQLDSWGWERLPPIQVHAEFRERIVAAIVPRIEASTGRGGMPKDRLIERWQGRRSTPRTGGAVPQ